MPHNTETLNHNPAHPLPTQTGQHLTPEDKLVFPMQQRAITEYAEYESGRELFISYDDKKIRIGEATLFAFGESLAEHPHFTAKAALNWGEGYQWHQIQPLLAQLLDDSILYYAEHYADYALSQANQLRPSPLPSALTDTPHSWLDCDNISQTLTGKSLHLAHLELVIPIYRVAHITLDTEGRQVGEANVFPSALRLDIATEWRSCPFTGSRFQDQHPMNASALRAMLPQWQQMMATLTLIRSAYLQRYPEARHQWTVGSLNTLSSLILAVPTYQLMRSENAVANGQLHPALSALFRIADGLRSATQQMIFIPNNQTKLTPNSPISSQALYEYCERHFAFHSEHGVCAGPKQLIEEFLDVLINGKTAADITLAAEVENALTDLNPAFNYGLYGLQANAAIFSFWPMMAHTYQQLWQIIDNWLGEKTSTLKHLHQRLSQQISILNSQPQASQQAASAYSQLYAHCAHGLGSACADDYLTSRTQPTLNAQHGLIMAQLESILSRQCLQNGFSPNFSSLLTCLMSYCLQTQAILSVAETAQQQIKQLLNRNDPPQNFEAAQINIHNLLQGHTEQRLSYLTELLEDVFKIHIVITKDRIMFTEQDL